MKKILLLFLCLIISLTSICSAHPGRTDSNGGHDSPSGYHYHHGYPAHQHTNGKCPYDFDDRTGENSGTPSSGASSSSGSSSTSSSGSSSSSTPNKKTPSLDKILSFIFLVPILLLEICYIGWIIWGLVQILFAEPIQNAIESRKRKKLKNEMFQAEHGTEPIPETPPAQLPACDSLNVDE